MALFLEIAVFLSSLAFFRTFLNLFKKKRPEFTIDISKQQEINRVFDEKIQQLKNEQHESMDKAQIMHELNRYRHLN